MLPNTPVARQAPSASAPIALALDGSLLAGTSANFLAGVLRLQPKTARPISIDRIGNAFSGEGSAIVPGSLLRIEVGLPGIEAVHLGLHSPNPLPDELSGVRVLFDDTPAPVLSVEDGQVTAVAPTSLNSWWWTSVQVSRDGVLSNSVRMPVVNGSRPGLLRRDFPDELPPDGYSDGIVANEDGTLNDAGHPAMPGSVVTAFATGLFPTTPPIEAGAIATSDTTKPVQRVYTSWMSRPSPLAVTSISGFVSSLFQVVVRIPESAALSGLQRIPFRVSDRLPGATYPVTHRPSNTVGIYVQY